MVILGYYKIILPLQVLLSQGCSLLIPIQRIKVPGRLRAIAPEVMDQPPAAQLRRVPEQIE